MDEGQMLMDIANHLQTVEAILVAMRTQVRRRPVEAGEFVAPKKGLEETLARIWSECLALEPIGARDNFFEFGGQSLIATRILTRARAEFGVEMGLTHLFERPTVREMAQYIENVRSAKLEGLAVSAADSSAVH
jgi:acyl carrier protein